MIYFEDEEEIDKLTATVNLDNSGETVQAFIGACFADENDVGIVTMHQTFDEGSSEVRVVFNNSEQITNYIKMLNNLKDEMVSIEAGNNPPTMH